MAAPPPWANGTSAAPEPAVEGFHLDYRPTKRLPGSAHGRHALPAQLVDGVERLTLGARPRSPFSEPAPAPVPHRTHRPPHPTHQAYAHLNGSSAPSGLFGAAGVEVVRSLAQAPSCARSDLFGGLRPRRSSNPAAISAAAHNRLRSGSASDFHRNEAALSDGGEDCDGEGCEGGCGGGGGGSVSGGGGGSQAGEYEGRGLEGGKYDVPRFGNNKKRKVPASQMATAHHSLEDDDEEEDEQEDLPAAVSIDRHGAATTRRTIRGAHQNHGVAINHSTSSYRDIADLASDHCRLQPPSTHPAPPPPPSPSSAPPPPISPAPPTPSPTSSNSSTNAKPSPQSTTPSPCPPSPSTTPPPATPPARPRSRPAARSRAARRSRRPRSTSRRGRGSRRG